MNKEMIQKAAEVIYYQKPLVKKVGNKDVPIKFEDLVDKDKRIGEVKDVVDAVDKLNLAVIDKKNIKTESDRAQLVQQTHNTIRSFMEGLKSMKDTFRRIPDDTWKELAERVIG